MNNEGKVDVTYVNNMIQNNPINPNIIDNKQKEEDIITKYTKAMNDELVDLEDYVFLSKQTETGFENGKYVIIKNQNNDFFLLPQILSMKRKI